MAFPIAQALLHSRAPRARAATITLAALGLVLVPVPASALAEEPELRASMQCDRTGEPGRVRCSVEAHVAGDGKLVWGDVVLLGSPPFAAPLRGRIGFEDASAREPRTLRWALALVARSVGRGELSGRVRVVVCDPRGVCRARTAEVVAEVSVGSA